MEAKLAEAVESEKAAAEAHADALKSETEERVRIEKELSDERDQRKALVEAQSEQLEEQTAARQRLEEDLSALTDKFTAMETQHDEALRAEVAAREAAEQKLIETKVALEAGIQSKTRFLAAMGRQIQNHLSANSDGIVEAEADAEDQSDTTKVTPLRRARATA